MQIDNKNAKSMSQCINWNDELFTNISIISYISTCLEVIKVAFCKVTSSNIFFYLKV